MSPIVYFLWPNPGQLPYNDPKIVTFLCLAFGLILLSFVLGSWRRRLSNSVTKRLSRSWSTVSLWFGIIALVLIVSRAEQISYMSMRLWWAIWFFALLMYCFFQVRIFRARYYEKLPRKDIEDPRKKYLPNKKTRR